MALACLWHNKIARTRFQPLLSFRSARSANLRCAIAHRGKFEDRIAISNFRVRLFEARRNDGVKKQKKARLRGSFHRRAFSSAAVAAMIVPDATRGPVRLQLNIGNTGGDVQSGLTLHADRLQRVGILRTANEKIAAKADADRGVGADAT